MPLKSDRMALVAVFVVGVCIGLVGDAAHVQAQITEYLWDGVPTVWKSALWFPFFVGIAITFGAWLAARIYSSPFRHDWRDALTGAAIILAIYCLTTVLADAPTIAVNALCWAIAVIAWLWWDASPGAFAFGVVTMVVGPAAEIMMVELGASRYLPGYDQLFGVGPWLLPLYFATGAILSGMLRALQIPINRSA